MYLLLFKKNLFLPLLFFFFLFFLFRVSRWQEDLFRRYATYLPANFIFGLVFLGLSWQFLYPIRYLNPLATLALLVYPTIVASKKFTDLVLYQVILGLPSQPFWGKKNKQEMQFALYFVKECWAKGMDKNI